MSELYSLRIDLLPVTKRLLDELKSETGAGSYIEVFRAALRALKREIAAERALDVQSTGK